MKKVLIISPYFPPFNSADMQRVRMSLPFFASFDWEPTVVCVKEQYVDGSQDVLLIKSLPSDLKLIKVGAFAKKITAKLGLGSIALRSLWFYKKEVDKLLKEQPYDLIYFSTTQFPVLVLGPHWKKKFGIPYVIDMQDPWHSDYYLDKPKSERPPKYWFSYRLNKWLEPMAMRHCDGLISVTQGYIDTLVQRYPVLKNRPASVITFGALEKDLEIAQTHVSEQALPIQLSPAHFNLVYVGRGGFDMHRALERVFKAVQLGLVQDTGLFTKLRIYFIGTSYAPAGTGTKTIEPLAQQMNLGQQVVEITDRLPFYQSLKMLECADALLIPGSDDKNYTASKTYPYLMVEKPILALFHPNSSVVTIIEKCIGIRPFTLDEPDAEQVEKISETLSKWMKGVSLKVSLNQEAFSHYSAANMTQRQVALFEQVLSIRNS